VIATDEISSGISHRGKSQTFEGSENIRSTSMFVRMLAGWLINPFVNRTTKVLEESTEDTGIDDVDNEAGMQVKGGLFAVNNLFGEY
jgi:hypothetical protein